MKIITFVTGALHENCYACIYKNEALIIDPGKFTPDVAEFVNDNSEKIKYILLTHRHFDHILGVADIKNRCPKAKIVIHELDNIGLKSAKESMAAHFRLSQQPVNVDILCRDGDELPFADTKIKVLHTPGHSVGSVCYLLNNTLFSGDTLFFEDRGRSDFPTGNTEDIKNSLNRLFKLDCNAVVYPGHGQSTTLEHERKHNSIFK